jgi:hypothetical protein
MPTAPPGRQRPAIPLTELARSPDGQRYYLCAAVPPQGFPDDALTVLVGFDGAARALPTARLSACELSREVVLEIVMPHLAEALRVIGARVAPLDPAFAPLAEVETLLQGGEAPDFTFNAVIVRLFEGLGTDPSLGLGLLADLEGPLTLLMRAGAFGDLAHQLLGPLGAVQRHVSPVPAETPSARHDRIRRDVRAELDALAASRPPIVASFRFEELIRPPRDDGEPPQNS